MSLKYITQKLDCVANISYDIHMAAQTQTIHELPGRASDAGPRVAAQSPRDTERRTSQAWRDSADDASEMIHQATGRSCERDNVYQQHDLRKMRLLAAMAFIQEAINALPNSGSLGVR